MLFNYQCSCFACCRFSSNSFILSRLFCFVNNFFMFFNFFFVIQNLELIKFICLNCCLSSQFVYNTTYFDCCQHTFLIFLFIIYGLWPKAPSSVRVSPLIYLKSGEASCTHTRPISFSTSPKCPIGGVFTFALNASG